MIHREGYEERKVQSEEFFGREPFVSSLSSW